MRSLEACCAEIDDFLAHWFEHGNRPIPGLEGKGRVGPACMPQAGAVGQLGCLDGPALLQDIRGDLPHQSQQTRNQFSRHEIEWLWQGKQ